MVRHERLEQDVKVALSKIISEKVKNPSVNGLISVTSVKITPDEKYSKVFISVYNVKNRDKVISALNDSSKFIRGCLSKMVKMRNTPELIFELDNSMEYGSHMDEVFKQMKENNLL